MHWTKQINKDGIDYITHSNQLRNWIGGGRTISESVNDSTAVLGVSALGERFCRLKGPGPPIEVKSLRNTGWTLRWRYWELPPIRYCWLRCCCCCCWCCFCCCCVWCGFAAAVCCIGRSWLRVIRIWVLSTGKNWFVGTLEFAVDCLTDGTVPVTPEVERLTGFRRVVGSSATLLGRPPPEDTDDWESWEPTRRNRGFLAK